MGVVYYMASSLVISRLCLDGLWVVCELFGMGNCFVENFV